MYVAALIATGIDGIKVYPSWTSLLAAFQWDKAPTKILVKYTDYADDFLSDLAMESLENTSINKHIIELVEGK